MSCPLCKSNDVRELGCTTKTIDNFRLGKFLLSYDIDLYYCMNCNNVFGKRSK